jgi:hypothetical protein
MAENHLDGRQVSIGKPNIDTWIPAEEDIIYRNNKGIIYAPVMRGLQIEGDYQSLDFFIMNPKKCYNSQVMRDHTCLYLNYFEKYYDPDKELSIIIFRIKYLIDTTPMYTEQQFLYDIRTYILNPRLIGKVRQLVEDNYALNLQYKNISENLQYTDEHAKIMLVMSLFMNFTIPLITHFAYINKIGIIDDFIMEAFDIILNIYPEVNIYSKLYETTYSNVSKSELKNAPIWAKQDIRGKDTATHSYASVSNIILNIMPKYTFDKSIISLNFTSKQRCSIIE